MSGETARLEADRAARDAAKSALDEGREQIRRDLAARGIGGRIVDTVVEESADAALTGIEVAEHNKGVIAGTVAALVLWFARRPIVGWVGKLARSRSRRRKGWWR